MPNRQRNTRANSARTPARPSVIQVTHKAVGSKINSVDANAKTSTGRLAPGMTPWKARTGIEKSSQLRPSVIIKNPVRGRRAIQPLNPVNLRSPTDSIQRTPGTSGGWMYAVVRRWTLDPAQRENQKPVPMERIVPGVRQLRTS
jgi:hypothetical protein